MSSHQNRIPITVTVKKDVIKKADVVAASTDRSRSRIFERALEFAIGKDGFS